MRWQVFTVAGACRHASRRELKFSANESDTHPARVEIKSASMCARCFASSCSQSGDNDALWSPPTFIPLQVIAMEPLASVFSLGAIEMALKCGLPEGMEVRMSISAEF